VVKYVVQEKTPEGDFVDRETFPSLKSAQKYVDTKYDIMIPNCYAIIRVMTDGTVTRSTRVE
jgi:hypothetical protein